MNTVGAPSAIFNVFIEQCDAVFPTWQPPYGELLLALFENQIDETLLLQALNEY